MSDAFELSLMLPVPADKFTISKLLASSICSPMVLRGMARYEWADYINTLNFAGILHYRRDTRILTGYKSGVAAHSLIITSLVRSKYHQFLGKNRRAVYYKAVYIKWPQWWFSIEACFIAASNGDEPPWRRERSMLHFMHLYGGFVR